MDPDTTQPTDQTQTPAVTDQPVTPPVQEPVAPTVPTVSGPVVPTEPIAVPEITTTDDGNMDGDTTPPIPGV